MDDADVACQRISVADDHAVALGAAQTPGCRDAEQRHDEQAAHIAATAAGCNTPEPRRDQVGLESIIVILHGCGQDAGVDPGLPPSPLQLIGHVLDTAVPVERADNLQDAERLHVLHDVLHH